MGESQNPFSFNINLLLEEGKKMSTYILGLVVTHEIWVLLHDIIESKQGIEKGNIFVINLCFKL